MPSYTSIEQQRLVIRFSLVNEKRLGLIKPEYFTKREYRRIVSLIQETFKESQQIPSRERMRVVIDTNRKDGDNREELLNCLDSIYQYDLNCIEQRFLKGQFEKFIRYWSYHESIVGLGEVFTNGEYLDDDAMPDVFEQLHIAAENMVRLRSFDFDTTQDLGFSLSDYSELSAIETESLPLLLMDIDDEGRQFPAYKRGTFNLIIGKHGSGKTQVTDAIMAQVVNRSTPKLIWQITDNVQSVLKIDTENGRAKVKKAVDRIALRAGVDPVDVIQHPGIKYVSTPDAERRGMPVNAADFFIEAQLERERQGLRPFDICIMDDGSGALENRDINDITSSGALVKKLVNAAERFSCCVIMTLHPNIDSPKGRPRGHLGAEATRWADSVHQLVPLDGTDVTYLYLSGNEHAKLREGAGISSIRPHAMRYDKNKGYFVEIAETEFDHWQVVAKERSGSGGKTDTKQREMAAENSTIEDCVALLMEDASEVSYQLVRSTLKPMLRTSPKTVERRISRFLDSSTTYQLIGTGINRSIIHKSRFVRRPDLFDAQEYGPKNGCIQPIE